MPRLLPGILVLSQRARYFSLHAYLLHTYQERRLPPTNNDLAAFIKMREFEYALAVQLCPRGCGDRPVGMVGKIRASAAAQGGGGPFARQESVESPLGGYGLYYRTPMTDLGLVVPRGSVLGEVTTPLDVLDPGGAGPELAEAFGHAIGETRYRQEHMLGTAPLPRDVLEELSEKACLCRLPEYSEEQALLRRALFEPSAPGYADATRQRCRSFALLLREMERDPQAADSNGAFLQAVWDDFMLEPVDEGPERRIVSEWAALAAKEWWQESLSSIWSHFLRLGGSYEDGVTPDELELLLREQLVPAGTVDVLGRQVTLDPTVATQPQAADVATTTAEVPLDDLRRWATQTDTAAAGLILLFALRSRLPDDRRKSSAGWVEVGMQSSDRQPSLLQFMHGFDRHLEGGPSLGETVAWFTKRLVIHAHEQIAYSKLPEFTFRFRWENGRLRFYTLGLGRFDLADNRRASMWHISEDVGLWTRDGTRPRLTTDGHSFVTKAFSE